MDIEEVAASEEQCPPSDSCNDLAVPSQENDTVSSQLGQVSSGITDDSKAASAADEVFDDLEQSQPDQDLIKNNMVEIGKSIRAVILASAGGTQEEGDDSYNLTKSQKVVKKADKIRTLSARFEANNN